MQRDEATQAQVDASEPDRSTWLSANAGSGKTRVLTNRVARLLLDQVDPQHILCLTYTKAAASEMQNRLFQRLGEWAMLTEADLRRQLEELGIEGHVSDGKLRHARRLFARAIETPGGLKIQTIHSFCSSILRRFPLEAGVTPQFTEMEERAAALLRAEIVEEIASGPEVDTLYSIARIYSGDSFEGLTAEIVRRRAAFAQPLTNAYLQTRFDCRPDLTLSDVLKDVCIGGEEELLPILVRALERSGPQDTAAAKKLATITELNARALPVLEGVFLTGSTARSPFTAKIGSFPTKACQKTISAQMPALDSWMARVEEGRSRRLAVQAIAKTRALHDFAAVFLPAYDAAKQARGWLDFDDLILRARDLLSDPRVAEWVLFRLDGGIDHILVDEAQDTSPVQWEVIEKLTREFTSGQGARADVLRTIFVVGDKKQSIYSFQGADPKEFSRMQHEFGSRLEQSGSPLNSMELAYSFRSSPAILDLVDHTFSRAEQSGFTPEHPHKAFKADMPGRVDLWPVIPKPEKEEKPSWFNPVDVKAANDPAVLLARQIASTIRDLVDSGHPLPRKPEAGGPYRFRPIQPGDILILVQRRSALFHEIIRECKSANLPIAGADRLKVGAELAVRDLAALLSFLATPEDNLSLAIALKSPLFGWTEAELFALAHPRDSGYLWPALRDKPDDHPETVAVLNDLLGKADFLRPYDLIERILTRHNGRHRLLSRLGPEAEDGIDALLSQAMAYERHAVDSLTGFLIWLEADNLEIKRQMDSAGNRIRVMTVHGAKGLESPVVILPDTAQRTIRFNDQIIVQDETALWRTASEDAPTVIQAATEDGKQAQAAERDRLLYVAMTRAENWLIVGAAGELGTKGDSWYEKIKEGLVAADAQSFVFAHGPGLRLTHGEWPQTSVDADRPCISPSMRLPDHFKIAAPFVKPAPEPLSPSDLGGAKALPGEDGLDEEAAKLRGRQIHLLLEHLPRHAQEDWPEVARQILARGPDVAQGPIIEGLLKEAEGVLTHPRLSDLFRGSDITEAPISATLSSLGNRRIHGVIDLLIVEDNRVLAIDFKTNALVPKAPENCPDGLLRQMGAYAHALQALYPNRKIETALLWTRTPDLMMLPHDLVTRALDSTQIS
jgi:ATP-dependent helicase/nuclease subunit A